MAVPSILIVAPSGRTKLATSFFPPIFSTHSRLRGRVPTEEALEKAIIIAGDIPPKNLRGLILPNVFTVNEYTTAIWMIYPA